MASRYSSYITTTNASSLDSMSKSDHTYSRALIKPDKNKTKSSNLTSMMKKLVETKSRPGSSSKNSTPHEAKKLYIPGGVVAEDLRKNGGSRGGGFGNIQKKLLKGLKGKNEGEGGSKALMEIKNVNGNSRNLAMVLRSERELLSANREQEEQIVKLQLLLEEKNIEVDKLKDLCLKQREEIKYLKNSILFPDDNVMDSHIKKLMEKESSELTRAKQSLQRQVTSLTGQLQCLAEDLAEVKANKIYRGKASCEGIVLSPPLQGYYTDEAPNSLEFSTTPGSPDDLFHKDLNPCLTPYTAKTKSKEFEVYDSTEDERFWSR